jgi:ABC-type nitrate/sulfonate/bicarbonate transport system ATPase subunit
MNLLDVNHLSFWYSISEPPVIYDCSFSLQPGEFLAIVGRSGCGKSTLLRLCCGLVQAELAQTPEGKDRLKGEVIFNDSKDNKQYRLEKPHPDFAYVAQNFQVGLLPSLTARKNVELAVKEGGVDKDETALARALLEEFEIADSASVKVPRLSGGQQQRVAICRALVKKPKLLFMDEPFANLDPTLTPTITDLLLRCRKHEGFSLLLVTHDISNALDLADRVLAIRTTYGEPEVEPFEKSTGVEAIVSWIREAGCLL